MMAWSLRGFLIAMTCLLCIWFLVGTLDTQSQGLRRAETPPTTMESKDPLYASKRRVPNGADPIHNRRAGKSGRPPGQA